MLRRSGKISTPGSGRPHHTCLQMNDAQAERQRLCRGFRCSDRKLMEKGCKMGLWLIRRPGSQGSATWSPQGPRQQEKLRILCPFLKNSEVQLNHGYLFILHQPARGPQTLACCWVTWLASESAIFCVFAEGFPETYQCAWIYCVVCLHHNQREGEGRGGVAYSSVPSLAHVHKHNKHTRFANAAPLILHFCLFPFALAMVSPEDIYLFVRVCLSLFGLFSGERLNRAASCLWCLDLIISDTDRLWKLSKQTGFIGSLDVRVVGLCSWDHHWIHYLRVGFWGKSQIFHIVCKNWNWLK